ncbi:hypothetical protein [Cellulomonas carbonis]|uniref:Lipoprotein n=1 Tax=Cellulomonas carbonis T26 TaxID=947969 RepID=A0A0A0BSC8_9CELL|nr:hypothetical protein [Cellulomonas carbonis]KGM10054.1 hypothetical protein N868_16860 [Cellulomonas carbonis T26]GGC18339.1 hypothetical protein GCM10010972_34460 [Cellulomonas carbonis]
MSVTPRTTRTTAAAVAVAAAALLAPAAAASAHDGHDHDDAPASATHSRAAVGGLVAEVRRATAQYRDVQVALDAGYVPVSGCETSPDGGMGIHYLNPGLVAPGAPVDPATPQILLYGPDAEGGLRLLGVEYWQPAVGQPTPVLGGRPFDGPMPGHSPDMPVHYDLHVWTEVANPDGVFAAWNPHVTC